MAVDIMDEFKRNRFLVVDNEYEDFHKHLILLCDLDYWTKHFDDLQLWCDGHGCEVLGMTVNVPDDPTLTLFCLRWT